MVYSLNIKLTINIEALILRRRQTQFCILRNVILLIIIVASPSTSFVSTLEGNNLKKNFFKRRVPNFSVIS